MFTAIKNYLGRVALIKQIAVGLVIGILIAVFVPSLVPVLTIFGDLFVRALKGVAPVLVFFLVMNAMAQKRAGGNANMKPIILLYLLGTFCASLVGSRCPFSSRPRCICRWPMRKSNRRAASWRSCTISF